MINLDAFFKAIDRPGIGTVWIRMGEVIDWLLLHGKTTAFLEAEALGYGFSCTEETLKRGGDEIRCLKIERAKPCFKPSLPVSKTSTEPSKSEIG